jgi:hypothetical protein
MGLLFFDGGGYHVGAATNKAVLMETVMELLTHATSEAYGKSHEGYLLPIDKGLGMPFDRHAVSLVTQHPAYASKPKAVTSYA